MQSPYQEGQKVLTPEGEGLIVEIIGENITVKLNDGNEKTFNTVDVQDDSAAG